jgi:hypothetical protein
MWRKTSEFAGWEARHALQLPVIRVFSTQRGCNQEGNHRGIARTGWPLCLPSCRESCSIPAANQPLSFRPVWRNLFLPDSHRHVLKPPHPSHFDEGRFSPNPERISTDEDASPENRCGGRCLRQHDVRGKAAGDEDGGRQEQTRGSAATQRLDGCSAPRDSSTRVGMTGGRCWNSCICPGY